MKSEGENWRERVAGKAAGDECVFMPVQQIELTDEAGSGAMPDAAGGGGVTGR